MHELTHAYTDYSAKGEHVHVATYMYKACYTCILRREDRLHVHVHCHRRVRQRNAMIQLEVRCSLSSLKAWNSPSYSDELTCTRPNFHPGWTYMYMYTLPATARGTCHEGLNSNLCTYTYICTQSFFYGYILIHPKL